MTSIHAYLIYVSPCATSFQTRCAGTTALPQHSYRVLFPSQSRPTIEHPECTTAHRQISYSMCLEGRDNGHAESLYHGAMLSVLLTMLHFAGCYWCQYRIRNMFLDLFCQHNALIFAGICKLLFYSKCDIL